jgi:adenylyltransferase/sulfurtransferase
VIVTAAELEAIRRQAVEEYPEESCGIIFVRGAERLLLRCRNDQNAKHAEDPERYPRDARTAYYIHADDLKRIVQLEIDGFSMAVIYHSHVDVGAYFSPTDRRQALVSGYLDPVYLVTSVVSRHAEETAAFRWDPARQDFLPIDLTVGEPARSATASQPSIEDTR